ncbi:MAG: DUF882 domain-containing protein [Alphaproteobacteria bacterium]|nr:DUF882 domain-containing protein [Alphaproteobacteria bacterium]
MGKDAPKDNAIARRALLRMGGGVIAAGLLSYPAIAARPRHSERSLSLEHLHTGEKIKRVYWADGRYVHASLHDIHHILRDYRTGEIKPIDVRLLDLLHDLHKVTGSRKPFEIISGYRSKLTNAMLAETTDGVARHSFHVRGMAVDIRLPDRNLRKLKVAALHLGRGGVGYYPDSDFVHVDVGPKRFW